jgi:hypothetical protein
MSRRRVGVVHGSQRPLDTLPCLACPDLSPPALRLMPQEAAENFGDSNRLGRAGES